MPPYTLMIATPNSILGYFRKLRLDVVRTTKACIRLLHAKITLVCLTSTNILQEHPFAHGEEMSRGPLGVALPLRRFVIWCEHTAYRARYTLDGVLVDCGNVCWLLVGSRLSLVLGRIREIGVGHNGRNPWCTQRYRYTWNQALVFPCSQHYWASAARRTVTLEDDS
jgi:hypothetical protein